jgi:hypothetical protein
MCMLFNMSPDPPVGTQLSVRAPLEPIKGRARTLEHTSFTNTQVHKHTSLHKLLSNTTHNGRRILRFGSLNHSKPSCASRVHTPLDQAFLDLPQTHPKLGLGGCTPPPGSRNPPIVTICYHQSVGDMPKRQSCMGRILIRGGLEF